jgi:hypothetical protein
MELREEAIRIIGNHFGITYENMNLLTIEDFKILMERYFSDIDREIANMMDEVKPKKKIKTFRYE